MMDVRELNRLYEACTQGTDVPDLVARPSYDDYLETCAFWGITPLPLEEVSWD